MCGVFSAEYDYRIDCTCHCEDSPQQRLQSEECHIYKIPAMIPIYQITPPPIDTPPFYEKLQIKSEAIGPSTIASLRLAQLASLLTMGGGPDHKPEHLLIIIPFPEPTEILNRIREKFPYITITYKSLQFVESHSWKGAEEIPEGILSPNHQRPPIHSPNPYTN